MNTPKSFDYSPKTGNLWINQAAAPAPAIRVQAASEQKATPAPISSICVVGLPSNSPFDEESGAVRLKTILSGRVPFRISGHASAEDIIDAPARPHIDTWPIDDLRFEPFQGSFEGEYDLLVWLIQIAATSNAAAPLVAEAAQEGWEAGMDNLGDVEFEIDVPARRVILNNEGMAISALSRDGARRSRLTVALLRALRDIWHEKRQGGFETRFGIEGILKLERIRAADCASYAALALYEIKLRGFGELWTHALVGEDGDILVQTDAAIKRTGTHDTRAARHAALTAGFVQWYACTRRTDMRDHETLEYIDDLIEQGGRAEIHRPAALDAESISCLPDRSAYLKGQGDEILNAPMYSGLHDSVNQQHFIQIDRDLKCVTVQGVAFRDAALAALIFPKD